jgi:protein-tyrosine kinase
MSRIHDALKKAELERAENFEPSPAPPAAVSPELATETELVPDSLASHGAVAAPFEPLTLEALYQRCPASPWHPDPKVVLFSTAKDHAPGTEEFRTLRSRLYQIREKQQLQTVLVASALPAEGKTFVALNLAQVIAQQKSRSVVVIDADLRISRMHEVLGASQSPGLSDYLNGEADIFSILQRGALDNLFLIAGGKPYNNPVELLSTGRLRGLMNRLTPIFDWIIIDSPPSVPLSDASLLSEVADGVLIVVLSGSTPYDMAQKLRQNLPAQSLLGVVLNRVPEGLTYTSYYYGYGKSEPQNQNGHKKK